MDNETMNEWAVELMGSGHFSKFKEILAKLVMHLSSDAFIFQWCFRVFSAPSAFCAFKCVANKGYYALKNVIVSRYLFKWYSYANVGIFLNIVGN